MTNFSLGNVFKTGIGSAPYLLQLPFDTGDCHGIVSKTISDSGLRIVAALAATGLMWADAAFASQGPGGGMGSATSFTQLAMAIIVWGTSALVVGAGLIGAVRRR